MHTRYEESMQPSLTLATCASCHQIPSNLVHAATALFTSDILTCSTISLRVWHYAAVQPFMQQPSLPHDTPGTADRRTVPSHLMITICKTRGTQHQMGSAALPICSSEALRVLHSDPHIKTYKSNIGPQSQPHRMHHLMVGFINVASCARSPIGRWHNTIRTDGIVADC